MSISVSISRIKFSSGQEVSLVPGQVLVIVGPNNSGKSTALREIFGRLEDPNNAPKVVVDVELAKSGSGGDLVTWLEQSTRGDVEGGQRVFRSMGFGMNEVDAQAQWNRAILGPLTRVFVRLLDAAGRLHAASGVQSIDLIRSPPAHPLHLLHLDESLEQRLSESFFRAFGLYLTLDRTAGTTLPLFCGPKIVCEEGEDRISLGYRKRLNKLPMLDQQGDGMRSFTGCLLDATIAHHPIVLIDEAEAFLHPPQANLLGEILSGAAGPSRQLVISTHDSDLLRGLLNSTSSSLKIVRVVRDGAMNKVFELDATALKQLWSDPLLRFSNVLDGLFHETVVVCEADTDCRFYSAVLAASRGAQPGGTAQPARVPDVLFTSCGGKAKLPAVVRALRKTGINTRVIADFDVLHDEEPLRPIVEALGGDWSAVESLWKSVRTALDQPRPRLRTREVKERVAEVLESVKDEMFPDGAAERIRLATKRPTSWDEAKRSGVGAVPSGEASAAVKALLVVLNGLGLFIVEVGELERFLPAEPGHGSAWVLSALTRDLANDGDLEAARAFMRRVVP